ncbi:SURF1 family protein, partial [Sphingomonas sp. Leaf412]|uniref:SURF1 family protein n=1 Tax=Sphingomonas sp. Leaf412 TaxID=1736370 RepID=UPI002AA2AB16
MARRVVALTAAVAAIVGLIALGLWQVERRAWKHALVAQVERRLSAPPVAAPGPVRWGAIGADDAYTRVRVAGRFVGADTRVQAVTDLGGGFWVVTPFRTDAGWTVLVNRGFVPGGVALSAPSPRRGEGRGEGPAPRREAPLGETS